MYRRPDGDVYIEAHGDDCFAIGVGEKLLEFEGERTNTVAVELKNR